ncbi:MAG: acyl-CoA thioesterase [Opitutaceae bacterium]|jgi:acyl-CoA thioester hydrolase/thioesterase-3|nr:acyl-CoA thioesterase [Opitutaceae bacterium]
MEDNSVDAAGATATARIFAKFETEMSVRPDDIDPYQHVHSTRYLDYVLAARFDQMERCYGMSMREFSGRGLGWYMTSATINYRRPLGWGDRFVVRTWIERFAENGQGLRVRFEIEKVTGKKRVCDGHSDYTLVSLATGRGVPIPGDILSTDII